VSYKCKSAISLQDMGKDHAFTPGADSGKPFCTAPAFPCLGLESADKENCANQMVGGNGEDPWPPELLRSAASLPELPREEDFFCGSPLDPCCDDPLASLDHLPPPWQGALSPR
jgi:hypothetical protein